MHSFENVFSKLKKNSLWNEKVKGKRGKLCSLPHVAASRSCVAGNGDDTGIVTSPSSAAVLLQRFEESLAQHNESRKAVQEELRSACVRFRE